MKMLIHHFVLQFSPEFSDNPMFMIGTIPCGFQLFLRSPSIHRGYPKLAISVGQIHKGFHGVSIAMLQNQLQLLFPVLL